MNQPPSLPGPDELDPLTLEERMAHMQALMSELQQRLEETRQQAEHTRNVVFLQEWRNRRR
jgi:hypothetical protein